MNWIQIQKHLSKVINQNESQICQICFVINVQLINQSISHLFFRNLMTFYSSLMYLHHLTQHNNYTITPNITTTTCKPSSSLILYNKPLKAVPKSIKWMTFDISLALYFEKYLQNICEARRDQTCDTWSMARGIFSEFNAVSRNHTQHHGKQKNLNHWYLLLVIVFGNNLRVVRKTKS